VNFVWTDSTLNLLAHVAILSSFTAVIADGSDPVHDSGEPNLFVGWVMVCRCIQIQWYVQVTYRLYILRRDVTIFKNRGCCCQCESTGNWISIYRLFRGWRKASYFSSPCGQPRKACINCSQMLFQSAPWRSGQTLVIVGIPPWCCQFVHRITYSSRRMRTTGHGGIILRCSDQSINLISPQHLWDALQWRIRSHQSLQWMQTA